LISLWETFTVEESDYSITAGLPELLQAALTLMRAADQVLDSGSVPSACSASRSN
jgi:hypothetical protein